MKRLMLLFLCLALVFPMAACDSDDNGGDAEKKFDPGYIVASSLDVTGKTATDDADGSHTGYKLEQFVEEATLDSLLDREDKVDPTDAGTDLFALFHYCAVASDFEPRTVQTLPEIFPGMSSRLPTIFMRQIVPVLL